MATPDIDTLPKDPVDRAMELVAKFNINHDSVMKLVEEVCVSPSHENLELLESAIACAKGSVLTISSEHYFEQMGGEVITGTAVEAVIIAANQSIEMCFALDDDLDEVNYFADDAAVKAIGVIVLGEVLEPDESEVDEEDPEDAQDDISSPERMSVFITQKYCDALEQLHDAVIKYDVVKKYIKDCANEISDEIAKIERLKLYGGVMLAAFIGTLVANKLGGRS